MLAFFLHCVFSFLFLVLLLHNLLLSVNKALTWVTEKKKPILQFNSHDYHLFCLLYHCVIIMDSTSDIYIKKINYSYNYKMYLF